MINRIYMKCMIALVISYHLLFISCIEKTPEGPAVTPSVKNTYPAEGQTVLIDKAMTVAFSCAMDPATIDSNSIFIMSGNDKVQTVLQYDATSHLVEITPDSSLAYETEYTLNVFRMARSSSGVNLDRSYKITFFTEVDSATFVPPRLKNLVVEFEDYDSTTHHAGDFLFLQAQQQNKPFLEFAAVINDGLTGLPKILPTFEYQVDKAAKVRSPIDGVVTKFEFQPESQDYTVMISSSETSKWTIDIDHIKNPSIQLGSVVHYGDTLGNPGNWSDSIGRVELQVTYHDKLLTKWVAPFQLFDSATSQAYQDKVWKLMKQYEQFRNDTTIYDQATMQNFYAGCLLREFCDSTGTQ